MQHSRSSLFVRLRASKLLRAWLLVLALASALAGLHAASHVGALPGSIASDLPLPPGEGDDPGTARHGDCPACRLAGIGSLALPVLLTWALLAPHVARVPATRRVPSRLDVAARWRLRRKQGPPPFSR